MSQDDLLRKLGQIARGEARSDAPWDERWDRLAAGTLSAEEHAELRRLAAASEDARLAYEAFRPLGPEFQARVVQAITPRPMPKPLPFPVTWQRRLARWSAAAAAAIAALVTIPPSMPQLATSFSLALSGGPSITRGDVVEVRELAPGDGFEAILSPDTAVRRIWPLRARAFLLRGAEVRRVDAVAEIDPSGAVRLSGTVAADLSPGTWTLWLVVGRWGLLPDPADLRAAAAAPTVNEKHWVAVRTTLRIHPRAP